MSYKETLKELSIKLNTDLIFYDLETTGLEIKTNTIIQLYICKYTLSEDSFMEDTCLYNPGNYIVGEEAYKKHGLSQEYLNTQKYKFEDNAKEIYDNYFKDFNGYLCGFNIEHFDNKFLLECFLRAGVKESLDILKLGVYDIYKLYQKLYPNKLESIYERLTGEKLDNAHDAKSDIVATIKIAKILMDNKNINNINFTEEQEKVFVDQDYFIYKKDKDLFFGKGKYKDKSLLTSGIPAKDVINYLLWITNQDILLSTKEIVERLIVYVSKKLNF